MSVKLKKLASMQVWISLIISLTSELVQSNKISEFLIKFFFILGGHFLIDYLGSKMGWI